MIQKKLKEISIEQIKKEFLRIESELREIESEAFGEMTFDQARTLIQIRRNLLHETLDKIRLLNDLRSLSKVTL